MADKTPLLVQKLRLQKGWSQDQLAAVSGLSTRTIQRLEAGRPASLETLKAVASVLEVDFIQLKEPTMSDPSSPTDVTCPPLSLDGDEALALAQVRRIRRFFESLIYFVVIGGAVVVLNIVTTPHMPWSAALLLAWAAGLLIAGLQAFGQLPVFYADWERREVENDWGDASDLAGAQTQHPGIRPYRHLVGVDRLRSQEARVARLVEGDRSSVGRWRQLPRPRGGPRRLGSSRGHRGRACPHPRRSIRQQEPAS